MKIVITLTWSTDVLTERLLLIIIHIITFTIATLDFQRHNHEPFPLVSQLGATHHQGTGEYSENIYIL